MFKKYTLIIFFFILIFIPLYKIRAELTNVGFIPSNIWYSKDPFEEGEKVKIYTLVFNPDARELSGTVLFFDDDILLGKKDFLVSPKGVKDVFVEWTATVGKHTISGKIESAKFLISAGKYEAISLSQNVTEESVRTVQKKITTKEGSGTTSPSENTNNTESSKTNFLELIKEKTPSFISTPIIFTINASENFRTNTEVVLENKKEELKTEIEKFSDKTNVDSKQTSSNFDKPLKYVELFFVNLFHFILNSKILFYSVSIILIFLILRYVLGLIF